MAEATSSLTVISSFMSSLDAGSNRGPSAYETDALPSELSRRVIFPEPARSDRSTQETLTDSRTGVCTAGHSSAYSVSNRGHLLGRQVLYH